MKTDSKTCHEVVSILNKIDIRNNSKKSRTFKKYKNVFKTLPKCHIRFSQTTYTKHMKKHNGKKRIRRRRKEAKKHYKRFSIAVTPIQTVPSSAKPLATCLSVSPSLLPNPNPPDHQIPPLQRSLSHLDHSEVLYGSRLVRLQNQPRAESERTAASRGATAVVATAPPAACLLAPAPRCLADHRRGSARA